MNDATKGKAIISGTIAKGGGTNHETWIQEMKDRYSVPDQFGRKYELHLEDGPDYTDFWVV